MISRSASSTLRVLTPDWLFCARNHQSVDTPGIPITMPPLHTPVLWLPWQLSPGPLLACLLETRA